MHQLLGNVVASFLAGHVLACVVNEGSRRAHAGGARSARWPCAPELPDPELSNLKDIARVRCAARAARAAVGSRGWPRRQREASRRGTQAVAEKQLPAPLPTCLPPF